MRPSTKLRAAKVAAMIEIISSSKLLPQIRHTGLVSKKLTRLQDFIIRHLLHPISWRTSGIRTIQSRIFRQNSDLKGMDI